MTPPGRSSRLTSASAAAGLGIRNNTNANNAASATDSRMPSSARSIAANGALASRARASRSIPIDRSTPITRPLGAAARSPGSRVPVPVPRSSTVEAPASGIAAISRSLVGRRTGAHNSAYSRADTEYSRARNLEGSIPGPHDMAAIP